jgi:hypothetical protein
MAINNENATNKISAPVDGRTPFTFRADYYYQEDDNEEIFDYNNLRNDRIKEISGWAVRDAGLNGEEDDELPNPGVYLSVRIGERHGVTFIIPEPELLKILAEIQRVKYNHYDIRTTYHDGPSFPNLKGDTSQWDVSWTNDIDTEDDEVGTVLCDCCFRG